jgi:transcriptional regulator with XRE-family HTH domain
VPPRRFDGRRLRAVRRSADMHQRELAKELGLGSHVPVATWESGRGFPPAEKLPGIARVLGEDIDELFPRDGDPDLVDLRCDAGYSQSKTAELLKVVSRFQLGMAERGARRLDESAVPALADLYGVSVEELEAAQARAFGEVVPTEAVVPTRRTLADTLDELIGAAFPEDEPTAEDVAAAVNAKIGAEVLSAEQVAALLSGRPATEIFNDGVRAVVFEALGLYFDVSPMVFRDSQSIERRVLEDIRYLAAQHDITLAARGGEGGVSPAFLAVLNELVAGESGE